MPALDLRPRVEAGRPRHLRTRLRRSPTAHPASPAPTATSISWCQAGWNSTSSTRLPYRSCVRSTGSFSLASTPQRCASAVPARRPSACSSSLYQPAPSRSSPSRSAASCGHVVVDQRRRLVGHLMGRGHGHPPTPRLQTMQIESNGLTFEVSVEGPEDGTPGAAAARVPAVVALLAAGPPAPRRDCPHHRAGPARLLPRHPDRQLRDARADRRRPRDPRRARHRQGQRRRPRLGRRGRLAADRPPPRPGPHPDRDLGAAPAGLHPRAAHRRRPARAVAVHARPSPSPAMPRPCSPTTAPASGPCSARRPDRSTSTTCWRWPGSREHSTPGCSGTPTRSCTTASTSRRSSYPTLHIWSDGDPALGRVGTDATAEWVDAPYRLEVLEGVGHWIPEEAADQVGPMIAGHIR